jgi:hypothetical protein
MRKAFRWLEKVVTYLSGLKPPVTHRFNLGDRLVFDSPRFSRGSVEHSVHHEAWRRRRPARRSYRENVSMIASAMASAFSSSAKWPASK